MNVTLPEGVDGVKEGGGKTCYSQTPSVKPRSKHCGFFAFILYCASQLANVCRKNRGIKEINKQIFELYAHIWI